MIWSVWYEKWIVSDLPPHPNVVRMFGVSIDGTQPVIILEYCDGGNEYYKEHSKLID